MSALGSAVTLRTVTVQSSSAVRAPSLRVHLLVLILGALLPGALLTAILVIRTIGNNRTVVERRLLDAARVDAAALDREFDGTIRTLQALASSPALNTDDLRSFYDEARRVQATQAGWYTILVLAPDGRQLVSSRFEWGSPLPPATEPNSVQQLVQRREPVVGLVRSSARGNNQQLFAIRVPVMRGADVKYALSAVVNVTSLEPVVTSVLPASEEWTRSIIDPEGTIAARTRGPESYVGSRATDAFRDRIRNNPEAVFSERTRDNVPVYAAVSRGRHGWTTAVVVPTSVLDAPLTGSLTALVAGGVLFLVCGLAAVVVVSRRLATDLDSATDAAAAVASGRALPAIPAHVAETRQLHESLREAARLLDERRRQRDEEVQRADAARREAEEANRTKDHFLAVLGHELRNPLAPALTALELIKIRDPQAFRREREVLERQVAHMARLVNDLLDVSRLARGKVQLERTRFELRDAVDRAVELARPLIEQTRHELQVLVQVPSLPLDGDIGRIVQVISNLLTNAAKYTPPGGRITLAARALNGRAVITFEDNGAGIAPELVPTLFEAFAQGPRTLDRQQAASAWASRWRGP